jgi:hypothetical protein
VAMKLFTCAVNHVKKLVHILVFVL